MKLKFIQNTSPKKATIAEYRWTITSDCLGYVLDEFDKCLKEVKWSNTDGFCAGIILLPKVNTGVVFRRIWSTLSDCEDRRKRVINGVVFSISDAQSNGINGIWELPCLADDAEENRVLEYNFNPSSMSYPSAFEDLQIALQERQNVFFKIEGKDKVYSLAKVSVPDFDNHDNNGGKTKDDSSDHTGGKPIKMKKYIPLLLIFSVVLFLVGYGVGVYENQEEIAQYKSECERLKNENAELIKQIKNLTVPRDINRELEGIRQQITIIEDALKKLQNADEKLLNLKERLRQLKAEINKERKIL